jgi:phosphoribosylanthranilate isomerase
MPAPATNANIDPGSLLDVSAGPRMKVCGIVAPPELDALARQGVDFVGLWYAVPGGPHDLPLQEWRALAAAASDRVAPVLVTFSKDAAQLAQALEGTAVQWVQLHGFASPGTVRKVKAISPEMRVLKVLHIRGSECLESSLIGAYEKAGVDVFLLDVVSEDGRVGSTGQALDPDVALSVVAGLNRPFLLAGGISAENRPQYAALTEHPGFLGIDVDTNARSGDGRISADSVAAISRAWKGGSQSDD